MLNQFQKNFIELTSIIEKREYSKLAETSLTVPEKFNWARDIFESLVVDRYRDRNMLELVTDDNSITTLTYQQAAKKCDQLLNLL